MNAPKRLQRGIFSFVVLVVLATITWIFFASKNHHRVFGRASNEIQCGHWCVLRIAQFYGAPLSMNKLLELLPSNENGHSFAQLKVLLEELGFEVIAHKQSLNEIAKLESPAIFKLHNPDHFIVGLGKTSSGALIYDGTGKRRIVTEESLSMRWSGYLLEIRRPDHFVFDPENRDQSFPAVQFEHLRLDKGDFNSHQSSNGSIKYSYPFKNVGQLPLKIESITVDCKCLNATINKTMVMPGDRGQIELDYSPNATNRHGVFEHSAIVETNDPSYPFIALTAAGNSDYRLKIEPNFIDFGDVRSGSQVTKYVFLSFWGDDPSSESILSIESPTPALSAHLMTLTEFEQQDSAAYAKTQGRFDRNNVSVIKVVFQANHPMEHFDSLKIRTSAAGFEELSLPFVATVEDAVQTIPPVMDLTSLTNIETRNCTIQLTTNRSRTFSIENITSTVGATGLNIQFPTNFVETADVVVSCSQDVAKSLHDSDLEIHITLSDGTIWTKLIRITCWE